MQQSRHGQASPAHSSQQADQPDRPQQSKFLADQVENRASGTAAQPAQPHAPGITSGPAISRSSPRHASRHLEPRQLSPAEPEHQTGIAQKYAVHGRYERRDGHLAVSPFPGKDHTHEKEHEKVAPKIKNRAADDGSSEESPKGSRSYKDDGGNCAQTPNSFEHRSPSNKREKLGQR